mgnify:CR=1 FL=1
MGQRNADRFFLTFALIALFFSGIFGVTYTEAGMHISSPLSLSSDMNSNEPMSGCLLTGILHPNTACTMNALAHIAVWREMFTAFPIQPSVLLLFIILFFALAFYAVAEQRILLYARARQTVRRRVGFFDFSSFHRPLQEAFSNGILHPKVF